MLQTPEVRYEVTDLCNAHCVMCPRDKHTREHGIMNQAQYEHSIDEVVALGAERVVLTGFGEPMLDTRLEDKIEYAKKAGLSTYIITNGSAINEKRTYRLLMAGLDEMRVSFYGMKPETYNSVMVGLDYNRTIKGLMQFISIRDTLEIKTTIQLSYLVMDENAEDVDEFKAFWEPKVDAIEIWKPHNFGDGKDFRERAGKKLSCGRPSKGPLQIQWNGEVIPCCYDYNNQIILGNAFETPIPDILSGKRYIELRAAHDSGEFYKFPYCDQCDQLLEHEDALIYTNRHDLPNSEAVKLSNTDLFNLKEGKEIKKEDLSLIYRG